MFSIALEKELTMADISGEIGSKLLLGFADDIDIIDINTVKVKKQFVRLGTEC